MVSFTNLSYAELISTLKGETKKCEMLSQKTQYLLWRLGACTNINISSHTMLSFLANSITSGPHHKTQSLSPK